MAICGADGRAGPHVNATGLRGKRREKQQRQDEAHTGAKGLGRPNCAYTVRAGDTNGCNSCVCRCCVLDTPQARYDKTRITVYDAAGDLRHDEHVRKLLKVKLHPSDCQLDPSQCSMHDPV